LELAGRYGQMTLDEDAFSGGFADISKSAEEAQAFALGVNWYMAKMVKFVFNYEQTSFEGGSTQGDRPTEHAILSRFQIGF
jgi:phosphate-selective porin OprO/OprP